MSLITSFIRRSSQLLLSFFLDTICIVTRTQF